MEIRESRDPRFAELDALIAAQRTARMAPKAPSNRKRKRRRAAAVPADIRKEVTAFARRLKREHGDAFIADPKLEDRVARMLRSMLPPKRRRGRSALDSVTIATRLLKRFHRKYPNESPEQRWARIYPLAIAGYGHAAGPAADGAKAAAGSGAEPEEQGAGSAVHNFEEPNFEQSNDARLLNRPVGQSRALSKILRVDSSSYSDIESVPLPILTTASGAPSRR